MIGWLYNLFFSIVAHGIRRQAKLIVNVQINDVNDGYPEFTKQQYSAQ